ncbi:Malonyl-CoA decarboxylase (MCD) [Thalassovita gelatinovora]|uniref:Malonyl-CoA decarboxylase (MCD) n=1 Tax=Thalassovita gelatinovora TaxID=53501 RepID=A0A0P1FCQ9_THAGE|nr:malonyl-CoA decarboxylase [Thalassovita gelatinovora]QIZ80461.1 malonyl-CoA decarboxylase [Thalassovita gelatinovora]CUH65880.1 Malonyl-CoA decarboxylase (MCD) [Thalassovita gelatinovora]SEQ73110.1 malonyl-CoA decarboxylase [Thalassovita gelatinovora]
MLQSSFLTDLLASITNRAQQTTATKDARPINELCHVLLSDIGDVSAIKVARAVLQKYRAMDKDQRMDFFRHLADDFDIDPDAVATLAHSYEKSRSTEDLAALAAQAEPRRQEILRRLNRVPGATADLVAMRCDLFEAIRQEPTLARIDLDFAHLFVSWFNPGFLVLRRINWNSPANILEKIIAYEAVHAIDSWDALRLRLLPEDRQCFAYFHPCMPEEPLIFVEVALTNGIPGNIQSVLTEDRAATPADKMDTAVFYSISNCQAGLRGISFGNALIKHVVEDLSASLPQLKTFVTLSPIPGFRAWIDGVQETLSGTEAEALKVALAQSGSRDDKSNDTLRRYIAHYLVKEKRPRGDPANVVARFHLGNGAIVQDVHADGDASDNGQRTSYGTMVNYLYDPARIDRNIEGFTTTGTVATSRTIASLLKSAPIPASKADS